MYTQLIDEIMFCERCGKGIECKINAYSKCVCGKTELSSNEIKYISKSNKGCLCGACLAELKQEYAATLSIK